MAIECAEPESELVASLSAPPVTCVFVWLARFEELLNKSLKIVVVAGENVERTSDAS